jgi:8-oxo-dGTP pyrophosphatase MutT (NUDIX family)
VIGVDAVRRALANHSATVVDDPARPRAAVAVVLRDADDGPEVLLIERARHPEDPWSGHMAFPGGRVDPADSDTRAAAERETLEEVGLPLAGAELLGRLDDLEGRNAGRPLQLVISAWVYHVMEHGPLVQNY